MSMSINHASYMVVIGSELQGSIKTEVLLLLALKGIVDTKAIQSALPGDARHPSWYHEASAKRGQLPCPLLIPTS